MSPFISLLPAGWVEWAFGGGLSLIFLWAISVAPARGDVNEFEREDVRVSGAYRN
ncbi:hypothetical protein P3T18_003853 [Paraburkholderia sp. GAS199]|uniref:hypothetical protein n=1 Tax=Paraburkholderia sp. GAS199 TaxID=3035126 RepID=UPI003D23597D